MFIDLYRVFFVLKIHPDFGNGKTKVTYIIKLYTIFAVTPAVAVSVLVGHTEGLRL